MTIAEREARLLYRPESAELRFLPEGPYPLGDGVFSWVAIQHGAAATTGSLHLFHLQTGQNERYDLPGRPGFAFPIECPAGEIPHQFVVGLERHVGCFDLRTREFTPWVGPVDAAVENTIINDGVLCEGGVLFGCKDLKFATKKAGLYLLANDRQTLHTLRRDQICSNGKQLVRRDNQWLLLDIDSPTKMVVGYPINLQTGAIGEPQMVLDLTAGPSFPDGMELTPDAQSIIISFYDPRDVPHGETRQYRIANGQLEALWRTPRSPRATCPRLIPSAGKLHLVITTAVEDMSDSQLQTHDQAGCLFIADTSFTSRPAAPRFPALVR
ncbi:MAG: SMP-30/gluconolactonase/LRE family protein [Planctomycetota bacterium]